MDFFGSGGALSSFGLGSDLGFEGVGSVRCFGFDGVGSEALGLGGLERVGFLGGNWSGTE